MNTTIHMQNMYLHTDVRLLLFKHGRRRERTNIKQLLTDVIIQEYKQ